MTWVWLALAGGCGAWCRFRVDALVRRFWRGSVPLGTLVINVTGSFVLGWLTAWVARDAGLADVRFVVGTGFLGGYTTFSTAAVEAATLAAEGRWRPAAIVSLGMVLLGLVAAALGLALGAALP